MKLFNFCNSRKKILSLTKFSLTLTILSLTTFLGDAAGNVNNNSVGGNSSVVNNATSVAPDAGDSQNSNDFVMDLSFVTVGDPGNAADPTTKLGAVSAAFQMGRYPVTAAQYAAFLNAVASQADPHGLYHAEMGSDKKVACIMCSTNADGTLSYNVISGMDKLPITYVNLNDAERFCNWLNNGAPTPATDDAETILQQNFATSSNALSTNQPYISSAQSTESGAYNFSKDANGDEVVEANPNANYFLPSQDQWVKAAYYKGGSTNAGYWMYPTQHDTAPNSGTGDVTNLANYKTHSGGPPGADFLSSDLAITTVDCFSNTITAYQVCAMAGNVTEWTMDTTPSGLAIVKGGSWASEYSWYYNNVLMRTATPKSYDPSVGANFIGFRIAASVDAPAVSLVNDTNANDLMSLTQANEAAVSSWIPFLKKWFGILWPFLLAFAISFGVGTLIELGALGIEMIPSLMAKNATQYLLTKVLTRIFHTH